ncbi:metallophosphoesterase family protein [Aneurinibacillus tyrosinisolvens]|uniref:metallophosphoesterase family protein n=1 Tax=Aneurinibacillus tyrosinisolvens TaxID=1443435 RepID=UPI00069A850F|nr:metallophosphoesterase [Aneurinibacillus tyrosinisolvens]
MRRIINKGLKRVSVPLLALSMILVSTPMVSAEGQSLPEKSFQILNPTMDTSTGVKATVKISPIQGKNHAGEEVVVFELMNGITPLSIAATEKDIEKEENFTVHFNVTGSNLTVKVFVVDRYGDITNIGNSLADPVDIKNGAGGQLRSAKIAVLSDTHLMDLSLGTSGEAYEEYLSNDRKLLGESDAILKSAVASLKSSGVQIVLVSGDLTKDGELVSHNRFAAYMTELENAGIKVYVMAGNHDINNPDAKRFDGPNATPVEYVSPSKFAEIYNQFGYGEAIARDPHSLSYVVEPTPGLWIISMDSALYDTNIADHTPKTGGAYSEQRFAWIKEQLEKARQQGKTVLGMTHHGIVQHFDVEEAIFPEYVIDDWRNVSKELADLGMKAVLTGHFHAQDIAKKETDKGNFIFDIETGSLVTYPIPYRILEFTPEKKLVINTQTVQSIDYNTNGKPFPQYAKDFLVQGLNGLVPKMLAGEFMKLGMPQAQAYQQALQTFNTPVAEKVTLGNVIVNAMASHYEGDEAADPVATGVATNLLKSTNPVQQKLGKFIQSLITDSYPKDKNITIDLTTGQVQ